MNKEKRKSKIGGQALIEGIMILTGSINTDASGKPLAE